MTHPIDPLTPDHRLARELWDVARDGDFLIFIGAWERMMTDHEKALERAYDEIPSRDSRA